MVDRRWPRTFADRLTEPLPRFRDVWRMMRERGPARDLAAAAAAIPVVPAPGRLPAADSPAAGAPTTLVTWVGHATFVVQVDGVTILTDPVWSRRIPGVTPRLTPAGVPWDALPPVDAVVISHNHYDHLDAPTIRRLPRDTPVLVPANLARWFHRRGFTAVTELDWWESHRVGNAGEVRCDFVPAHHWSRRTLTDTCRSLWGGWVLTSAGSGAGHTSAGSGAEVSRAGPGRRAAASPAERERTRIYFAGDTGYGHWFSEIGARYPGIDLALLPVGAYEPRWFMRPMHLNPEEAVRACEDLSAVRMATMHWGTFVLSAEPVTEPPERAAKAWAETGRPREHLWDLAIGETRSL